MLLPMQRLHLCHESVQFTHIGRGPGHALLFVRQIVKVKLRHLYAAADTDRIEVVLSAVAGILHIQRAAALTSGSAAQLGHVHDVGSYLQVRSHCAHRGRLGMVLGGHKLQAGSFSRLLGIVAHIDHDLLLGCSRHAQGLPCIQAAEASAHLLRGDVAVDPHRCLQILIAQDCLRRFQLPLQQLFVRMQLSADLVRDIDLRPQSVYGLLGHILPQHGV